MDSIRDLIFLLLGVILSLLVPPILKIIYKQFNLNTELYEDSDSLLLNVKASTRWMNMGYWEGTEDFVEANRKLAIKLCDSVGSLEGARILDIGYGSGESLKIWEEQLKPASCVGVTSLKSQFEYSLKIKEALQIAREELEIELIQGDAAKLSKLKLQPASFDVIFSLDAAYHFNTRDAFLSSGFDLLRPTTGQLAMTDLVLADGVSFFDRFLLSMIFYLASVPQTNMISMAEYDRRMQSVGYEVTTITDISEQVFLPFVSFLEQRHKTQLRGIFNDKWKGLMMYGKIVKWWAGGTNGKPKLLFILVHARKPKSKDA